MKKVLVITYYWPPAGGGGVQRTLKHCKYLPEFGWDVQPVVHKSTDKDAKDMSLVKDTSEINATCAHDIVSFASSLNSGSHSYTDISRNTTVSMTCQIISYMKNFTRINFCIPDTKILWYRSAIKAAERVLKHENIDILYSTSPPYTAQLVALALKRKYGLPWVVDFRDPWVENVYYNVTYRNPISVNINRRMESLVLSSADRIITVGENLRYLLEQKTNRTVDVIPNGYDSADFPAVGERSQAFTIGYYGSLNKFQFPENVMRIIKKFRATAPDLYRDVQVCLAGSIPSDVIDKVRSILPDDKICFLGYLQHDEFTSEISKEQLLLQFIHEQKNNKIIVGSKLYEYIHTGNPILCIGNTRSDGAQLVRRTRAGMALEFADTADIREFIVNCYRKWKNRELNVGRRHIVQYERKSLAKSLSIILNDVQSGTNV